MVLGKQSVAEAEKEFLNHAVGEEGRVNSCRIVWWSERTSSPIHISEQRGAVHQQMHTQNHTAYHIQFGGWFSGQRLQLWGLMPHRELAISFISHRATPRPRLSVYWSNNDYKLECQRSLITVLLVNCCVEGGCHGAQLVKVACKVLHGDVGAERRDSIRQQHSCCGRTEDLYVDRLSTGQRRWNHAVCVSTSTHFTITVVRKLVIK